MKQLAYEFERAAIDAGFEYARVTWQAASYSTDAKNHISVFAVDYHDKTSLWKAGEE